ncbi:MAG TPA: 23S rRNA (pseudouridine(1915)-N(3))-methyltransferase RlmH [Pseudomonadales bacterium]|nr:23S rRNA (pseudouridine(1915)-N(3))-methyltransferase RlmH [Pseudomonadales bacterium]
MRLNLCAVGTRPPAWVAQGFADYAKRLPRDNHLDLTEVAAADRRRGGGADRWKEEEAERLLQAAGSARIVALEVGGRPWSTEDLAARLEDWRMQGGDVAFLVGGPDGLAPRVLSAATQQWSLSPLTLPHALVRIVVAEQLYRAWTLMTGHPYHR